MSWLRAPLRTLRDKTRRRLRAWARRRVGSDDDPLRLVQRRVYIFPTGMGFVFAAMLVAMLLGAMNYSNSLAFALTFMLGSLGFVAMHHCHRNLLELVVRRGRVEPVFAGGEAVFHVAVENPGDTPRYDLQLEHEDRIFDIADVPANGGAEMCFRVPAERRGWLDAGLYGLSTTFPLGLFRAWTWIYIPHRCIVYPKPVGHLLDPPPIPSREGGGKDLQRGDEDFSGLRGYRLGDSPRHIHWKAYAREQGLQLKLFTGAGLTTQWLDFDHLPADMGVEQRLSQLCRWVLDAELAGRGYGLRLPGKTIAPGRGEAHRRDCLTALALFGESGGSGEREVRRAAQAA